VSGPGPQKRPTAGATSGQQHRDDLLQAYKDLVHEAQEKATQRGLPPEVPAKRHTFLIVMLLILILSLGSLVLFPQWYFPPDRVESPLLTDASLRLSVHREILRVEEFKKTNGRLPVSLKEAGGGETGVQYTLTGDSYTLSARSGSMSVSYESGTSPDQFLGDAYDRIRRRK
jgi:hypothetical protein